MKRLLVSIFLVVLVVALTSLTTDRRGARAGVGYCNETVTANGGCFVVCPQGDGDRLDAIDGVITIVIMDIAGNPIPGIPAADFWLFGCGDVQVLCGGSGAIDADSATNAQGQTTISGAMAAGGCDDGLLVVVQGVILSDSLCTAPLCLPYPTRSPDFNADLVVNLVDFSVFGTGYPSPPRVYDACLDFNCDGVINLVDFSVFGRHYLHVC